MELTFDPSDDPAVPSIALSERQRQANLREQRVNSQVEMDAANNTVASYRDALRLEADEGGNNYGRISFSIYRLAAEGGDFRLNLTCVLPPQTSISAVVMTTPILESDFSF